MSEREGVIRTTGGDVDPASLGMTSMHEHVLLDATVWYQVDPADSERLRDRPVTLDLLPDVRWHAYSSLDNLILADSDAAAEELSAFRDAGGDAIVDTTSSGLGGDPRAVAAIADTTGVRVIVGAGHYVHASHDPSVCAASVDDLEEALDAEVREGVRGSGVRPGILGEIGMSAPPEACERRALRAAARVAVRYGMSVTIHVDGAGAFGLQHVEDCVGEGLVPDRVVCGHADEHMDREYHRSILTAGANLAFDTFGSELRFSGAFHHPSDAERMRHVADLVDEGFGDQIVLGQDVFVKAHLHRYGGNGYDHLPRRVLPTLRESYGVEQGVLDRLVVENPRRLLTCRPPGAGRGSLRGGERGRTAGTVLAAIGESSQGGGNHGR